MYFDGCKLNEISQIWRCLPYDSGQTPTYMNSEWFQFINDGGQGWHGWMIFASMFYSRFGEREIILPDSILDEEYDNYNDFLEHVKTYISVQLDLFYWLNNTKYGFYYNVLIDKTYNPIWNLDATETRSYTKDNTGTQDNDTTKTGNYTDNKTLNYTGSETESDSGTDTNVESGNITNAKSGTRTLTNSGTDTTTKSGSETTANVPMETTSFYDTTKTTYNNVADETQHGKTETESFTNYTDTETFNSHQNQRTLNTSHTKSFTNRQDTDNTTVTYNNLKDANKRTDNLKEEYEETITRSGNQGVTKSQEMVTDELVLRAKYDLLNMIMSEMAQYLLYMC